MPLASSSTTFQQHVAESEPNAVPLFAPRSEDIQVSVKNTFINVVPKSPQQPTLRRSITVANASSSSSSDGVFADSQELRLPLNLASVIDSPEMPAKTPSMNVVGRSPLDAYFNGGAPSESPCARWLEGYPSDVCQSSSCTDIVPLQDPFAMGAPHSVPCTPYFVPVSQSMMIAPMMTTMCPVGSIAPSTLQPAAQPSVMLVPQHAMHAAPPQMTLASSSEGAAAATANANSNPGVWEDMAAWKRQQSGVDREVKWDKTRSPFSTSSQKTIHPRGKNSKKPPGSANSMGPRAVFVDLTKIVPTGIEN